MGFFSFFKNKKQENLIDYVYVCREGDNEELRYSIRSVIENGPAGNIWIVGGKPEWYTGNFIPVPAHRDKYVHVRTSLNVIIDAPEIADDFVLMNDDFFILKPIEEIEMFHGGTLRMKISRHHRGSGSYGAMIHQLFSQLRRLRPEEEPLDYELHVPMEMNKKKLFKILKRPFLWRSLYGNIHKVGGKEMADVKVYSKDSDEEIYKIIERSPYISSNEASFEKNLGKIIKPMFPNKSRYEL